MSDINTNGHEKDANDTSDTKSIISDVNGALTEAGCGFGTTLQIIASYAVIAREAMAIEVLAIVALIVKCEWNLSTLEMTSIQVCGVISQLLAALIFSNINEKLGRKIVMLSGMTLMTVIGILSGLVSQHFWQLLLFRTLMGATIGVCDPSAALILFISRKFRPSRKIFIISGKVL